MWVEFTNMYNPYFFTLLKYGHKNCILEDIQKYVQTQCTHHFVKYILKKSTFSTNITFV